MDTYELARIIVQKLINNLGPDLCTWGNSHPDAYKDLAAFKPDMIEDVKQELEINRIDY